MSELNLLYLHYEKTIMSDKDLQLWLDKLRNNRKLWLILLDEKLKRAEREYEDYSNK